MDEALKVIKNRQSGQTLYMRIFKKSNMADFDPCVLKTTVPA